jgi:hypothetical protein
VLFFAKGVEIVQRRKSVDVIIDRKMEGGLTRRGVCGYSGRGGGGWGGDGDHYLGKRDQCSYQQQKVPKK